MDMEFLNTLPRWMVVKEGMSRDIMLTSESTSSADMILESANILVEYDVKDKRRSQEWWGREIKIDLL